jgi:glycosyltransferase involved in cell wall biosynthesis
MCSREDPAPLVVFEAASVGVPTVCFHGAGGAPEFVSDDAGICVTNRDTLMMANAVVRLLETLTLRVTLGKCARQRVYREHVPHIGASRILDIVIETIATHHKALRT